MTPTFKKNRFLFPLLFTVLSINAQKLDVQIIKNLIFEKTNQLRLEKNVSELTRNKLLDKLSQYHSDNMVKYNFFNHTDSFGDSLGDRAKKMNIHYSLISENIALTPWYILNVVSAGANENEKIATFIFNQWLTSPGHYSNVINNSVNEIGIGIGIEIGEYFYVFCSTQNFRRN